MRNSMEAAVVAGTRVPFILVQLGVVDATVQPTVDQRVNRIKCEIATERARIAARTQSGKYTYDLPAPGLNTRN